MGLTKPGDEAVVTAAVTEFIKLCRDRGLSVEQICQATIAVAAAALTVLHGGDKRALMTSLKSYAKSLASACEVARDA